MWVSRLSQYLVASLVIFCFRSFDNYQIIASIHRQIVWETAYVLWFLKTSNRVLTLNAIADTDCTSLKIKYMGLVWFVAVSSLFLCYNLQVKFLVPQLYVFENLVSCLVNSKLKPFIRIASFVLKVTIEDDTYIWPHIVIIGPLNGLVNISSSFEVTQIQFCTFLFFYFLIR